MNLDYLYDIAVTTECGSIHKAADQLFLRQQNLSSIIKKVESYYGITIFERTSKGVKLTVDGQYFMERVHKILALEKELKQLYRYPSNKFYANVVDEMTLYIPNLLSTGRWLSRIQEFNRIFPYVNLHILTLPTAEALEKIQTDDKAIVTVVTPFFEANFTKNLPDILQITKLSSRVSFSAIVSANNMNAAQYSSISVKELLTKTLVLQSSTSIEDHIFYQLLKYYGDPQISYIIDNTSLFVDFMNSGNYWSLAQETSNDRYGFLHIPIKEDLYASVHLIYHKTSADSLILQTLISLLSEKI